MQSDQQHEAEGGRGLTFPGYSGGADTHSSTAQARRSGGAPLPSAATHKGLCDLSLNPRDPAQHLNWGKRPPPFLTQSSPPGVLLAFLVPLRLLPSRSGVQLR